MGADYRYHDALPIRWKERLVKALAALWRRMSGMFGRTRRDMDLAAEIESHIELHTSDHIPSSLPVWACLASCLTQSLGGLRNWVFGWL